MNKLKKNKKSNNVFSKFIYNNKIFNHSHIILYIFQKYFKN